MRISSAAALLGVSPDTLRRAVASGELSAGVDAAGVRVVDGAELARFARKRSATIPNAAGSQTSARNQFPGLVTAVRADAVMAQVEMQCGPFRVVSLMSSEAVEELGLEPGAAVVASIKATNVVVASMQATNVVVTAART